ncbi:MAG: phosphomannomutase CpsG, partial [Succinivibrio sp.]
FIKERMRREDAVYGGEMSAHHYFRDFFYCDSGMLPWLLVAEQICRTGTPLSAMLEESERRYPVSGEINSKVSDAAAVLRKVEAAYKDQALSVDHTDGVSIDMGKWRFNVRMSNTEPVVRLNVESRGDKALMEEKTSELLALIRA